MKRLALIAILAIATSTSLGFAQTQALNTYGNQLFSGRPFFTDENLYSSYHLGTSPLGLFDLGSPSFAISGGYRYAGLGDGSGHYLSGQSVWIGEPGRYYFKGFYGPDLMAYKNSGNASPSISLPLQRFGFAVAAQAPSELFRSSFLAEGYYGKQEWKEGDSARALMGIEKLRLDFGAHPHPLFRVGFFFGVTGLVDTLYTLYSSHEDRSAQMNLPEFGANLDFGGEGVPVKSSVTFSYAFSRFVYTMKGSSLYGDPPSRDPGGNADAIINDSFDLFWVTRGQIPIGGGDYVFAPALLLGFTGNAGELHEPNHDDNNPITIGQMQPGSGYDLGGFWLGLGAGIAALKYANVHAEYALSAMSLESGTYYTNPAVKRTRTLHHVSGGVSTDVHEYVTLPLNITPRIAYFISGVSGQSGLGVGVPHLSLDPLNAVPGKSKRPLYAPQNFLSGFERVSGFTIGVDGVALEEQLTSSLWATFLSSSDVSTKGGVEIGARVSFWVK